MCVGVCGVRRGKSCDVSADMVSTVRKIPAVSTLSKCLRWWQSGRLMSVKQEIGEI